VINVDFGEVRLFDNENIKKIRLTAYKWEELIGNKEILYKALCDLLLSEENLFYYASQKESTKTLVDTRKYIKKLIDKDIIDSTIEDVLSGIGWKKEQININSTHFQGDLAEYLMCILLDKITNVDTIISKVSLKTSPRMPSYGNDNIYYDYEKEILYYGESKFYDNVSSAIKRAKESLEQHANAEEFSFIRSHDNVIIAEDGTKRIKIIEELEEKSIEEITIKSIFFIANDDIYLKADYESKIIERFESIEELNIKSAELIMVFLPILSKGEFLNYFKGRLEKNEG
jgi:hypothetical protein